MISLSSRSVQTQLSSEIRPARTEGGTPDAPEFIWTANGARYELGGRRANLEGDTGLHIPKRRTGHGTPALRGTHTTLSRHQSHTSSSVSLHSSDVLQHRRRRRRRASIFSM